MGKPSAYGRAQGWREAQAAKADPGHAARVDGREDARHCVLVSFFPAWILDQRIEVKTEFIASRLHTPCRRQSRSERSRIVFLSIGDLRRGERPRHNYPLPGVESEEPLNTVTLGLEFREDILTRSKEGDQVSREV